MPYLSQSDHSTNPPTLTIPRQYNAAYDLLQRNLQLGLGDKCAFIDDHECMTYAQLEARSNRFAQWITQFGILPEQRLLLCLHDTIDFPTCFLGAIKAGVIPVAVNTLLTAGDYEYMLNDSKARIAVISPALLPLFKKVTSKENAFLQRIIVAGGDASDPNALSVLLEACDDQFQVVETLADEPCFWAYSSGSTGAPKGTVHVHSSMIQTAELYAKPILNIHQDDLVFSIAKLFFPYGLGNSLIFPMSVGATTVLMSERPTPDTVFARLRQHRPTIFYAVPTLYAAMLAHPDLPKAEEMRFRCCVSAGEPLPEEIGKRWTKHFGVDILDGIGSTEMLHIYLSNQAGDVRYGTTGKPVPGYSVRLLDDQGLEVPLGESGELYISGPTSALHYWNQREKSRSTFQGLWTRSGDKYSQTADGYFVYGGRSDDMLKVSGIYVSPIEVESALIAHEAVLEAAVIGCQDDDKLVKPKAYVVLKPGISASDMLATTLKTHVKSMLAPYKYPRWFEFVDELPKTATGKIQRFKLRSKNS